MAEHQVTNLAVIIKEVGEKILLHVLHLHGVTVEVALRAQATAGITAAHALVAVPIHSSILAQEVRAGQAAAAVASPAVAAAVAQVA